ncbi:MAG: endonuclease domain-containing protein [Candidatus Saccharibacteria bacterium]|nr:endonuclease domain-containing protein [Candidatus Saccharibacteria bacterium]
MKQYKQTNRQYAKTMRQTMTEAERTLWFRYLYNHKPRFYKQRPIGNYIADFYCSKARLVIEIDGGQHYDEGDNEAYDQERTECLNKQGIYVLRFTNTDVMTNLEGVVVRIQEVVEKRLVERSNPPD